MVSYNTQIDNTTKKYKIQFETDDYDVFKWVEKICSNTVIFGRNFLCMTITVQTS